MYEKDLTDATLNTLTNLGCETKDERIVVTQWDEIANCSTSLISPVLGIYFDKKENRDTFFEYLSWWGYCSNNNGYCDCRGCYYVEPMVQKRVSSAGKYLICVTYAKVDQNLVDIFVKWSQKEKCQLKLAGLNARDNIQKSVTFFPEDKRDSKDNKEVKQALIAKKVSYPANYIDLDHVTGNDSSSYYNCCGGNPMSCVIL